ncbi:PVC-type heme-binding CxxCH protein [Spirosoma montaniterrae]|uniref:Dehydrogenase n=1 Tax=Spirosoma montaniterrae TaxID=1178516 RepID=A0A1P9X307_9BACT|nr:PVC-type heme-binding CxxCH protein [Spirosoma montaniterrae]AQG81993.1 dehydrogenase [Spirosoma montaniterrae]
MHTKRFRSTLFLGLAFFVGIGSTAYLPRPTTKLTLGNNTHIALIGNNLGARMLNYGSFETELHLRYPDKNLFIRNLCDGGDTPGFRPHAGRMDAWAFPGAEKFQTELAQNSSSIGTYPKPDEWLTTLKADVVIAFFGFSESYAGPAGLPSFKAELSAFVEHTLAQRYNGSQAPQLALVSPIAFQDLSKQFDLPNGVAENRNLSLYAKAIEDVARQHSVLFLDAFTPAQQWFQTGEQLTIDGQQLNEAGYSKFARLLVDGLFGPMPMRDESRREAVRQAVLDHAWHWHNDYKIPNGVHVYGRRYKPFGPDNYPAELAKIRQMTANRDTLIWRTANGQPYDLAAADARTSPLPPVETNFKPNAGVRYLYGDEALRSFTMAPGYKIELFASEKEFSDLANPAQIAFDNRGRLWVATMPTYPHYRPGDARPNDKLIILEDTNGDGKADKQTVFADNLHLPTGFELTPQGVYIAQGTHLKRYIDTNGDDRADQVEIVLSGFDDHDTHHNIHAFSTDESGAIYMGEGVFLHSNVETPYGTIRGTHGGYMRYNPQRQKLDRVVQNTVSNPWGVAFDTWGQPFCLSTSSPDVFWLTPGSIKARYGFTSPDSRPLIEQTQRVRPTSGLEFVSSRHFPDEVQGDMMLNNTIGFLGTKMHQMIDDGTGYQTRHRMDLVRSSDPNFRPVDMEFAPDGSLYLADWHNVLIGHMQHNARDPLRDHVHGRIYRITYPARPLVTPAPVDGASVEQLLENLKLPEYRTRYRTRRELREHSPAEVLPKLQTWIGGLNASDANYQHHLLEALWVSWGLNQVDQSLLTKLLKSPDYRVRAAAVRVARFNDHQLGSRLGTMLTEAARDPQGRVRMEAMVASTWLPNAQKEQVLATVEKQPVDDWIKPHLDFIKSPHTDMVNHNIRPKPGASTDKLALGKAIYSRDGYCITCHQADGTGLESAGFPPLAKSNWVTGSPERLIKLVMHGLYGPLEVNGKKYPGNVPMTPYGQLLNDDEMVNVLNYIRSSFGNSASVPVTSAMVKQIREQTKTRKSFYTPDELLKQHPN